MTRAGRGDEHAEIGGDRIRRVRGADEHLESSGITRSARYHASGRIKREPRRKPGRREAHGPDSVGDVVSIVEGRTDLAIVQGLCDELEVRVARQDKNWQNSRRIVGLARVIS